MVAVALALVAALISGSSAQASYNCEAEGLWLVTGYVRTSPDFNPFTADGTSIFTSESIAAAPYWLPFDTTIGIVGLGEYRVADRGSGLGIRHIDVAVWSRAEAMNLTGCYPVYWY